MIDRGGRCPSIPLGCHAWIRDAEAIIITDRRGGIKERRTMSIRTPSAGKPAIEYPDSDGRPMADNTLQFEWIVTIKSGLEALFHHDPGVFVAGDLLWY